MRLISKFHDYYDTAIGFGIDPNIVYVRKTKKWKNEPFKPNLYLQAVQKHIAKTPFDDFRVNKVCSPVFNETSVNNVVTVLFCGKMYVGIQLVYIDKFHIVPYEAEKKWCYDVEQIKRFYDNHEMKLPEKPLPPRKVRYGWRGTSKDKQLMNERNLKRLFKMKIDYPLDIHHELDTPIIQLSLNNEPVLNPELKKIEFFKKLDAFTAFQEISMFISGVMGGKSPKMVEISDSDRLSMHGFNEWSFRKEPEK